MPVGLKCAKYTCVAKRNFCRLIEEKYSVGRFLRLLPKNILRVLCFHGLVTIGGAVSREYLYGKTKFAVCGLRFAV